MKKYILLFACLSMLFACQQKENKKTVEIEKEDACGSIEIQNEKHELFLISEKEFNALPGCDYVFQEEESIDDKENVFRTEGLLTFNLTNGETVSLKDKFIEYDSDVQIYKYLQSYDVISYWLYDVSYYEGGAMCLLDKDSGEKINVWSVPVFSPNKKYFITSSFDIEAGYCANGIQLFEIKNGKVVLVWEFEASEWGPKDARWIDNETIAIQKTVLNYKSENDYYDSEYVKMSVR